MASDDPFDPGPEPGIEVDDVDSTSKTMPGFTRMWSDMLAGRG